MQIDHIIQSKNAENLALWLFAKAVYKLVDVSGEGFNLLRSKLVLILISKPPYFIGNVKLHLKSLVLGRSFAGLDKSDNSVNSFIQRAIRETMERDNEKS